MNNKVTKGQYNNYKSYFEKLKKNVKSPDKHFQTVCENFKNSLQDYRESTKNGWGAIWFGMDQQIGTKYNKVTKNAILKGGTTVISKCMDNKITLYHGFQSAGKPIPIGNTKFKIFEIEKKDGFWYRFLSSLVIAQATKAGHHAGNSDYLQSYSLTEGIINIGPEVVLGDKVKNTMQSSEGSQNHLNENGMAELKGLEKGKLYAIQFTPEVTQTDFDKLFASYQSFIDQILSFLCLSWETVDDDDDIFPKRKQCDIYKSYYEQVQAGTYQLDGGKIISAVISGIWHALCDLWDGLVTIFNWATNPESYVEVAKYLSNPEQMKKDIDALGSGIGKFLSILKDEALLFLIFKAICAYIELLTPEQANIFVTEGLVAGLMQTIISIFIPGRLIKHALDFSSIVGGLSKSA